MNPNSAKFHHFDRHQGQTVAGLSSGISSARSQALTEHGSGGRFPFLSQQFRWTRTCHLGFRNTVGRLLLEEQAIHGHGIASISIGWPVFLWGSGIRPTSVALCARLWAAMPGSLVFFWMVVGEQNAGMTVWVLRNWIEWSIPKKHRWLWINTYENTIFRGMNIHKSQLFWCEQKGYKVLTHCQIKTDNVSVHFHLFSFLKNHSGESQWLMD